MSKRLEKWLISRQLNYSCGPSSTLSKILETPSMPLETLNDNVCNVSIMKTPEKSPVKVDIELHSVLKRFSPRVSDQAASKEHIMLDRSVGLENEGIDTAIRKLSLKSESASLGHDNLDPFNALLEACGQPSPLKLLDVFSKYWYALCLRAIISIMLRQFSFVYHLKNAFVPLHLFSWASGRMLTMYNHV